MIKIQQILETRQKTLQSTMESKPLSELKNQVEEILGNEKNGNDNENGNNNEKYSSPKFNSNQEHKSFKNALTSPEDVQVICEYKPASPSMGDISETKLEDAIDVFEGAGASAVSILTEENYFKGSLKNLKSASEITEVPLIRKDFLMHEYQIYEAKLAGASAVLLMSGVYPDLEGGIELASTLGMDSLVECRSREDIENALKSGAQIIGVNNRNFKDFTIDLKVTEKLACYIPPEIIFVSESGVKGPEDALRLAEAGADTILIGTGIMGQKTKSEMMTAASDIIKVLKGSKIQRN
ncbi:indole-3-glycerol phosphate synthase TrpC [Methanobacterium congolense]|uniref:Indole-3-glycerol phosphate synthase n=1 Tax=Methanobacterium congolense TaxID=118062 RepID=A0A1D3L0J3_9EURY|nr:indole-3-glycerol-phosphate synthase [Methanobacterium congolense]SCG85174.1 Indole-3-glycerol phosphate synthase [Methanobacterium congolense]